MVIKAGKAGNVAGSYVTDGRILRGGQVRLFAAASWSRRAASSR